MYDISVYLSLSTVSNVSVSKVEVVKSGDLFEV